jgi:hypothetical protein
MAPVARYRFVRFEWLLAAPVLPVMAVMLLVASWAMKRAVTMSRRPSLDSQQCLFASGD